MQGGVSVDVLQVQRRLVPYQQLYRAWVRFPRGPNQRRRFRSFQEGVYRGPFLQPFEEGLQISALRGAVYVGHGARRRGERANGRTGNGTGLSKIMYKKGQLNRWAVRKKRSDKTDTLARR